MSDCDEECEDCDKGICQSNQSHLARENDNANKDDPDTNSHNVTVNIKTESMGNCDLMVVKEKIKEEGDEEDRDIHIKQEYVHEYIKTESSDDDVMVEIKQEIKEEYEDDHDDDCD